MHLTWGLVFARPKGALRLSARRAPAAPAQRSAFGAPQRRAFGAMVLSREKTFYFLPCFTLPLHLPGAYEASSARHGCASLTLARKTEVAQLLKHYWVLLLNE